MDTLIEPRPVAVSPLIRCSVLVDQAGALLCGRPAPWQSTRPYNGALVFHCDQHRNPLDRPIERPIVFQGVTLYGTVQLASGPWAASVAQADAIAVVEQAIRQAGGLLTIHDVTSAWCRHWPEPATRLGLDRRARG